MCIRDRLRGAGRHKIKRTASFLRSVVMFDALSRGQSLKGFLPVSFYTTRTKCLVNQMEFTLGIVCHLGGVTLYTALVMDCQRKSLKKPFKRLIKNVYLF